MRTEAREEVERSLSARFERLGSGCLLFGTKRWGAGKKTAANLAHGESLNLHRVGNHFLLQTQPPTSNQIVVPEPSLLRNGTLNLILRREGKLEVEKMLTGSVTVSVDPPQGGVRENDSRFQFMTETDRQAPVLSLVVVIDHLATNVIWSIFPGPHWAVHWVARYRRQTRTLRPAFGVQSGCWLAAASSALPAMPWLTLRWPVSR
jgi:hypothetical protein